MSGLTNSVLIYNQMVALEAAVNALGGGAAPAAGSPLPAGALMDVPEGSVPPPGWVLAEGGTVPRQAFPKYAEVTPFTGAITAVTKHVVAGLNASQTISSLGNFLVYSPGGGALGGVLSQVGSVWTKGPEFVPDGQRIVAMYNANVAVTVSSSDGLYHFWEKPDTTWGEVFTGLNLHGSYYETCATCIDGFGVVFKDYNIGYLWSWTGGFAPTQETYTQPWAIDYSIFTSPFTGYTDNDYAMALENGANSVRFGNLRKGGMIPLVDYLNVQIRDYQGDLKGDWLFNMDTVVPANNAAGDASFLALDGSAVLLPTDATNLTFQEHLNRSGMIVETGGVVNLYSPLVDYHALRVVAGNVNSASVLMMSWTPDTWFVMTHADLPPQGTFGGFLLRHPSFGLSVDNPIPPELFVAWGNGGTQYVVEIQLSAAAVKNAPLPTIAAGVGMKKAIYLGPETKIPIVYEEPR